MSAQCETTGKQAAGAPMGVFERYLTVWVFLCIGAGILLGQALFHAIGAMEVVHVNLPVAVLIWLMILPMLLKIDLKEIKGVRQHWRGVDVLIEVPVMLAVVRIVSRTRTWYEAKPGSQTTRSAAHRRCIPKASAFIPKSV